VTTPRVGHPPIDIRILPKDGFWDRDDLAAGDACWQFDDAGRRTLCLCLPLPKRHPNLPWSWVYSQWTIEHRNSCNAQWSWDGNENAPTLTPSLHAVGVWHGFVTAGKLVEC